MVPGERGFQPHTAEIRLARGRRTIIGSAGPNKERQLLTIDLVSEVDPILWTTGTGVFVVE